MIQIDGRSYRAHIICWALHYQSFPSKQLDHINGVKDDNRIENLREVSNRQNSQNRNIHRHGKMPGIYKSKTGKWVARVFVNGKRNYLGAYLTDIEAFTAYRDFCSSLQE